MLAVSRGDDNEGVWVVTKKETADKVLKAIADAGNLTLPGEGFAYVQSVAQAVGIIPPERTD